MASCCLRGWSLLIEDQFKDVVNGSVGAEDTYTQQQCGPVCLHPLRQHKEVIQSLFPKSQG